MGNTIDQAERMSAMEEAFNQENVPALMPAGPQAVTIDDRPQGALKVAVNRQTGKVLAEIKAIANAAGDDFFYRWPAKGKDGGTDWIEGPSVKCTNAVARIYGNCSVKVRAIDQGTHWMIGAQFNDLETGYVLERPFQQRKSQNIGGKMDKDRALDIVFQIGISKATRNVVANALSEFVDYAFTEAKNAIVGRVEKDIARYRGRVSERLHELKVDVARVERQVGRTLDKWLAPDIARVIAEIQSVNDGMADPDDMWPTPVATGDKPRQEDYIESKTQQIGEGQAQQQTQQQAKPTTAPATEEKKPADEVTGDLVADEVTAAITQAANADADMLEQLDDTVCGTTDRTNREDQRKRWNECYVARKATLRAIKAGGGQKPATETAKASAPVGNSLAQGLDDYFNDSIAELKTVTSIDTLDPLEERVRNELAGNEALFNAWKNACNNRARELARGRR